MGVLPGESLRAYDRGVSDLRPRRRPDAAQRRRRTVVIASVIGGVVIIALVAAIVVLAPKGEPTAAPSPSATRSATATPSATPTPSPTPTPTPTPTFDKTALSIDDPASIWLVVDKLRPLNPADYEAPDLTEVNMPYVADYVPYLRAEAAAALEQMLAAFTAESGGRTMSNQSSYRPYSSQERVYAGWVATYGQEGADLTSARPGYSEHQTGLAIDLSADDATCSLDQCFADTVQGQWLAANSWQYGFILRYPNGYTPITGYEFEPWHYRYVGVALATEMHNTGVMTLEEFFGLPAAPTYAG